MKNLLKINVGIAFISLLMLICVLSSVMFLTASFIKSGKTIRGDVVAKEQAYYNSLSGVEYAYYKMFTNFLPKESEIKFNDGMIRLSYDAQSGNLSSLGVYSSIDDNADYIFSIKAPRVKRIMDCLRVDYKQTSLIENSLVVRGIEFENVCDHEIKVNGMDLQCKVGKLSGKVKKISIDGNTVFYDEGGRLCNSKIKFSDYKVDFCRKLIALDLEFEKPVDKSSIKISFDFE